VVQLQSEKFEPGFGTRDNWGQCSGIDPNKWC
jgi:hypothetical protein